MLITTLYIKFNLLDCCPYCLNWMNENEPEEQDHRLESSLNEGHPKFIRAYWKERLKEKERLIEQEKEPKQVPDLFLDHAHIFSLEVSYL